MKVGKSTLTQNTEQTITNMSYNQEYGSTHWNLDYDTLDEAFDRSYETGAKCKTVEDAIGKGCSLDFDTIYDLVNNGWNSQFYDDNDPRTVLIAARFSPLWNYESNKVSKEEVMEAEQHYAIIEYQKEMETRYKEACEYCADQATKDALYDQYFGNAPPIKMEGTEAEEDDWRQLDAYERKAKPRNKTKPKKKKKKTLHKPTFGETKKGVRVTKPKRPHEKLKGRPTHFESAEQQTLAAEDLKDEEPMSPIKEAECSGDTQQPNVEDMTEYRGAQHINGDSVRMTVRGGTISPIQYHDFHFLKCGPQEVTFCTWRTYRVGHIYDEKEVVPEDILCHNIPNGFRWIIKDTLDSSFKRTWTYQLIMVPYVSEEQQHLLYLEQEIQKVYEKCVGTPNEAMVRKWRDEVRERGEKLERKRWAWPS